MKNAGCLVGAILFGIVFYLVLSCIVDGYYGGNIFPDSAEHHAWAAPDSWHEWRDIVIVLSAGFWVLGGLLLCVMMGAVIWLLLEIRKLLKTNVAPAVDSLKESLDNVRGTTEFAGETIASPIVRAYSLVRGVRSGVGALRGFPDRVKGRRTKKKKGRK
jgi:hypothetical protein